MGPGSSGAAKHEIWENITRVCSQAARASERKRERVSGEQGTRTVYMRQQGEGGRKGGKMRKRERERETCFEILIHGSGRGLVHRDEKAERTFEAGGDVLCCLKVDYTVSHVGK